ncbi:hypothetical protein ACFL6Y_10185 [Elusimicrobiota bacterium]
MRRNMQKTKTLAASMLALMGLCVTLEANPSMSVPGNKMDIQTGMLSMETIFSRAKVNKKQKGMLPLNFTKETARTQTHADLRVTRSVSNLTTQSVPVPLTLNNRTHGNAPARLTLTGSEGAVIGGALGCAATGCSPTGTIGGAYLGDKAQDYAGKKLNNYAERDQTQESRERYGGCRMQGTCSK